MFMKIGCDTNILMNDGRRLTKAEYSKIIKEFCDCGFSHYNLGFEVKKDAPLCQDNYLDWAYEFREALDENNAKCVIAHEPCFFKFQLTEEQKELQRRMIEVSKILGIEWIVMHPIDENGSYDKSHMKSLLERNCTYFLQYAETLERYGVGMAVETLTNVIKLHYDGTKRQFGDNPYDLIELVDKIGSEKIQICVDIGHLNTVGIYHIGDTVRDIGSRLKALHIHDNNGILDEHLLPFMGKINWTEFVHALKDIDYQGYFTYEASKIPTKYPRELRSSWLRLKHDIAEYIVNL